MIPASCQRVSRLFQKVCHLLAWLLSTAENTHIACEPCAKCNCSPFQYKRTTALKTVSAAVLQLPLKRTLKFTFLCKTLDASRPTRQGEYNIHVPYSIKKSTGSLVHVIDMPWRIHNMAELIYTKGCVQWRGIHDQTIMYKHSSYANSVGCGPLCSCTGPSQFPLETGVNCTHGRSVTRTSYLPFSSERSPHKQHGCAHKNSKRGQKVAPILWRY